jgi:integrase
MAKPFRRKGSKNWYIAPVVNGVQMMQSAKTTDYQEALDLLRRLEGKIVDGLITPQTNKALFSELSALVKRDYKIKKRRSEADLIRRIDKHIDPALGALKASAINAATISQYIERRLEAKASNGEINRELAAIKRAYSLGRKTGLVIMAPYIEMLPEENIRTGFFNEEHFRAVLRHSSELLKDVLVVAFYTGWRIDSILNLEWSNVDEEEQVLRLRENQTKNRKATTFPLALFPEFEAAIARRKESKKGLITPWVFHREGERAVSIRKAWENARRRANVPGRLIHDLRRTAVRNLTKMGFTPAEVMNMVGIKTLSIYLRYCITTEADIMAKAAEMARKARAK